MRTRHEAVKAENSDNEWESKRRISPPPPAGKKVSSSVSSLSSKDVSLHCKPADLSLLLGCTIPAIGGQRKAGVVATMYHLQHLISILNESDGEWLKVKERNRKKTEPAIRWKEHFPQATAVLPLAQSVMSRLSHPKFNRMSGILPWKNAIFLFITAPPSTDPDAPIPTYSNLFLSGGRYLSYYASPSMHATSPMVQRITQAEIMGHSIHLFFRPDAGSNFTYGGRLRVDSVALDSRPILFMMEVVDALVMGKE